MLELDSNRDGAVKGNKSMNDLCDFRTLSVRRAGVVDLGWTDGKSLPVIRLKPSRREHLKSCLTKSDLPTLGRVLWRQIFKLPCILGYGKQKFIRDGRRGIVPQAYWNAEFERYEWESSELHDWMDSLNQEK